MVDKSALPKQSTLLNLVNTPKQYFEMNYMSFRMILLCESNTCITLSHNRLRWIYQAALIDTDNTIALHKNLESPNVH